MAAKLLTASGAVAASGANNRIMKLILSSDGVGNGTAVFKTGGSGGTNTSITFTIVQNGSCVELDLAPFNIIADYLTLANAEAMVLSFGD